MKTILEGKKIKGKKKKEMTKTLQIEKYCASEIQCGTTQYAEQPHPTCQYKELSQTGGWDTGLSASIDQCMYLNHRPFNASRKKQPIVLQHNACTQERFILTGKGKQNHSNTQTYTQARTRTHTSVLLYQRLALPTKLPNSIPQGLVQTIINNLHCSTLHSPERVC